MVKALLELQSGLNLAVNVAQWYDVDWMHKDEPDEPQTPERQNELEASAAQRAQSAKKARHKYAATRLLKRQAEFESKEDWKQKMQKHCTDRTSWDSVSHRLPACPSCNRPMQCDVYDADASHKEANSVPPGALVFDWQVAETSTPWQELKDVVSLCEAQEGFFGWFK